MNLLFVLVAVSFLLVVAVLKLLSFIAEMEERRTVHGEGCAPTIDITRT